MQPGLGGFLLSSRLALQRRSVPAQCPVLPLFHSLFLGRVRILLAEPFPRSVVLTGYFNKLPIFTVPGAGAWVAFLRAASVAQGRAFPFYCLLFSPRFGEEEGLGHPWDGLVWQQGQGQAREVAASPAHGTHMSSPRLCTTGCLRRLLKGNLNPKITTATPC